MSKKTLAIVVSLVIVSFSLIVLLASFSHKKVTASTADSGIDPAQGVGETTKVFGSSEPMEDPEKYQYGPEPLPENEVRIMNKLQSDPKNKGKLVGVEKGDDGFYHLDRLLDRPDKSAEEYFTNGERIIVNGDTYKLIKLPQSE